MPNIPEDILLSSTKIYKLLRCLRIKKDFATSEKDSNFLNIAHTFDVKKLYVE